MRIEKLRFVGITPGILDYKHDMKLGKARGLFEFLVMKQTPTPVGYVNYGHPINYAWIIERYPGMPRRTCERWLATLRDEGYISTELKSNGFRVRILNPKKWTAQLPIPFDKPVPVQAEELRKTGTSGTPEVAHQVRQEWRTRYAKSGGPQANVSIYVKESIKENNQDELAIARSSLNARAAEIVDSADLFEIFFSAYPRQVQRQLARDSWIALRLDDHLGEILASIDSWKRSGAWNEERYIPYPKTFLRHGIWKETAPLEEKSNAQRKSEKRSRDAAEAIVSVLGGSPGAMACSFRRTLPAADDENIR